MTDPSPLPRPRREWILLAGGLVLLALLLAWGLWQARAQQLRAAEVRLSAAAASLDTDLFTTLRSARAALQAMAEEAAQGPSPTPGVPLPLLVDVIPGVTALHLESAPGAVADDPAVQGPLDISPPYLDAADGRRKIALALAMSGGRAVATLDLSELAERAASRLSEPGTWLTIVHGRGDVVLTVPDGVVALPANVDSPGTLFRRHLDRGENVSVLQGESTLAGEARLIVLRTVRPQSFAVSDALVVGVSLPLEQVLSGWSTQAKGALMLWLLLAGGAGLALSLLQRRDREREHERRAATERLALALAGGDLGLWDLDLRSGRCEVNDRWYTMLGEAPGSVPTDAQSWLARLHPDDRAAAAAAEEAHRQGLTAAYEARYRIRHADGGWRWILDRGRVVERDADGRALRMAGTHLDVTEAAENEQALRRNEQSLETTLLSIGDGVIATDRDGRVTRMNAVAEALTGWTLAEAAGRPLAEVFRVVDSRSGRAQPDPAAIVLAEGRRVGLSNDTLLRRRDGSERAIADSAAPILGADGAIDGAVLVFSDVSERYRMTQALAASEASLRQLLDTLGAGVVEHGPDTAILRANPAACRVLGLSLAQLQGRKAMDPRWRFVEADGSPMPPERYPVNLALRDGAVQGLVGGVHHPDRAGITWVLVDATVVKAEDGGVRQVVVTFVDITARQRAEDALRDREARLRLVGRMARIGGFSVAWPAGRLEFDAEAQAQLGLPAPALDLLQDGVPGAPGSAAAGVLRAAGGKALGERLREAMANGQDVELEALLVLEDHRRLWLALRGSGVADADGRVRALAGAVQDISARQEAQHRLRLLRAAVDRLGDIVMITEAEPLDEPGPAIVYVNPAFERITGWTGTEVMGRSPRLLHGPQTDRAELARIGRALRAGQSVRSELVNVRRDGTPYWVDLEIAPMPEGEGLPARFVAIARDVTARKAFEQQLRSAQMDLEATLGAVPDLLFEIDADGVVHSQHSPRSDLLVLPAERQIGRRFQQLLPPEAAEVVRLAVDEAIAQGHSSGQQYTLELAGGTHWFELSVARKPVPPGQTPRVILLARDISDRRRAEDERRDLERRLGEAHKLESIGTLASGIAHDFNNLLPAILGNVALALDTLGEADPARDPLLEVRRAALRARSLVQQILTYARSTPQRLQVLPLAPLVQETLSLLRAVLPAGVGLVVELPEEPLYLEADETQLHQVLMNLCLNAAQAMPEGHGRIALRARALAAGSPPLPDSPGGVVAISVVDDGVGMDAETRQRVFEPFFTTKPVGQGTGLGLAVAHGIVCAHGGVIAVDSEPGQGCTVSLWLPRHAAPPAAAPTPPGTLPAAGGGGAPVLYVDDDEVVTLMVQRLLERLGFVVTTFPGVAPALRWLRDEGGEPALVVSDFNMPGASGLDLARAVRELRPGLPVVITSGYIDGALEQAAQAAGVVAVLRKEHTLEELGPLLQRVLAGRAGPGQPGR